MIKGAETAKVVIIGAGVIGCSTAYHLARTGVVDVVVLEMEQVGAGSSGLSASMLSMQFASDALMAQMARWAYDRYMQFEAEIGVPIDFKKTGWLSLATAEYAPSLLASAGVLQALGIETHVLTPDEVAHRYPEINTADIAVATYGPDDGAFDPHMIMWGYISRARSMGVRLRQGVRATGVRVRGGRVVGVETDHGFIASDIVINAAGPWAGEVGAWVGVDIPLVNLARTIVVTGPLPAIPSDRPFVEDVAAEWYFRPEGPGILMGMGKRPVENLQALSDYQILDEMIGVAVRRVPVLERATVLTSWTGVRPLTADGRPIVGAVPGLEGFFLNCGWGGVGIIQAPLAGQMAAEEIVEGRNSMAEPFRLARFESREN